MPFTLSHVAAVVPAYRPLTRARVFSAAVIGSMAPDFGMLIPLEFARWQTHSLQALLYFCLPVGLAGYGITQALIKPAVLEVLPDRAYLRLRQEHAPAPLGSVSTWLRAALAVLFGALTHLVWDGFTHEDARGVRFFPFLEDYGPEMAGHSLQLYRWLQYGSSLLGLALLVIATLLWWQHAPPPAVAPARRLSGRARSLLGSLYLLLPLAALAWVLPSMLAHGARLLTSSSALTRVAVLFVRASAASLALVSCLIRLRVGR